MANVMGEVGQVTKFGQVTNRYFHGLVTTNPMRLATPDDTDLRSCEIDCLIISELLKVTTVHLVQITEFDHERHDYYHCRSYKNGKQVDNFVSFHEEGFYAE